MGTSNPDGGTAKPCRHLSSKEKKMKSHEKISGTAETIAFVRGSRKGLALSPVESIAQQISKICNAEEATKRFYQRPDFEVDLERMKKLRPWSLLRLEAIREAVKRSGVENVFELASGFSPAGYATVFDLPVRHINYLETDLPDTIERKRKIIEEMQRPYGPIDSLMHEPVNALDGPQMLEVARKHFKKGPVAIVHEGLLQYFEVEEKFQIARNIRKVLEEFGGVWITTDIVLRRHLKKEFERSPYMRRIHEIMTENTGRDMVECGFNSYQDAKNIIKLAGFKVEHRTQADLVPVKLSLALGRERDTKDLTNLAEQQIWAMRLEGGLL